MVLESKAQEEVDVVVTDGARERENSSFNVEVRDGCALTLGTWGAE